MHITVKREELQHVLELVGRVSTKHVTLPVLQCVLLVVEGDTLTLRATNLEIGIEATLKVKVEEVAQVAVPASTFLQVVSLLSDATVELRLEGEVLEVIGKHTTTNLKTFSHDEFPSLPQLPEKGQGINRNTFALGVKSSAFACSASSIKPELGSVYIYQRKEHSLTFVATDSFRLMEKTVPQKNLILEESLLLPQKNAVEIARVCEMSEVEPEILVNENQCALRFPDGTYITSRMTNGTFPDYQQIIPKEYSTHVTLLKQDLVNAFKRSSVFLNKFQQVTLNIGENDLTLTTNNGELGTATESIKASTEGEDLTLSFNQRYLSDCLTHFADESITLHFAGIGRPLVITGVNDSSTRYLVMPMNK